MRWKDIAGMQSWTDLMDRMSELWVDFKVALRSVIFMVPDHTATEKQMLADRHDHLSCSSLSKEGWWVSQQVSVTGSDGQRGPQQTSKKFNLSYLWFVVSEDLLYCHHSDAQPWVLHNCRNCDSDFQSFDPIWSSLHSFTGVYITPSYWSAELGCCSC